MELDKLFYPDSVAVVGASENKENMASMIVANLINWNYPGPVFAVNPKGGKAFGKEIYPSLMDIPEPVDLVAVLAPARTIPDLLDQAHEKGIHYMCIETAGFSELNEEGRVLGELLKSKALEYDIKFVGPNGLGVINAERGLYLPFSFMLPWEPGPISVIAQSGGVGLAILNGIQEHNLTANKFVSLGNKYCLDEVDFLRYFIADEGTKIILIYLEGVTRGREFIETAAASPKPILLFKANTTRSGAERAQSHTAALANDDRVLDAAVKHAGITRVRSLEHLIHFATTFLQPPIKGKNLSIVSPAGGMTVIAADEAEENGFAFPPLSAATEDAIKQRLRSSVIRLGNPIDLGDGFSTDTQMLAMDMTLGQDDIDAAMFMSTRRQASVYRGAFKSMLRNPVPDLGELVKKHGKPVITVFSSSPELIKEYRGDSKVPIYNSTVTAIGALAAYRDYCTRKKPALFDDVVEAAPEKAVGLAGKMKPGLVAGAAAFDALKAAGLPVVPFRETADEDQALEASEKMGYPVAMKLVSSDIVHKTESGALRLNLKSEKEARAAFRQLQKILDDKGIRGKVLVQKMAGAGVEAIIGSRRDPQFGQVLMFGLGGIFVEILKDVVFHLAPVNRGEALEMIGSIKAAALLRGARGAAVADVDALADAIVSVGRLIASCPQIGELDINPIVVFEKGLGCAVVDARLVIG
jgi:acetate---CoA ligase (ADP-forming)